MKVFIAHEHLLKEASPFFAKALEGEWKESTEGIVPLPDDEPVVFSLYLKFLYVREFAKKSN